MIKMKIKGMKLRQIAGAIKKKRLKVWSSVIGVALAVALILTLVPVGITITGEGMLGIELRTVSANPGWLSEWTYRKSVPVSGSTGSAAPYQMVDIEVYKDDNTKSGNGQVDCEGYIDDDFDGIRFTASDGTTLLDKFPHDLSSGTSCEFDVACPNGASSIYCYFDTGKSAQTYPLKHGVWGLGIGAPNFKQQGVRHNGTYDRTYVAYQALDNSCWLTAYSHDDSEWLTPKKVADSLYADAHSAPGFDIDPSGTYAGYGHIFFGWHDTAGETKHGKYYRADLDIVWASVSFTDKTTALGTIFCSYPQISVDDDGRLWFFFRGASSQTVCNRKQSYMYSDDNGDNWSSVYTFIDFNSRGYLAYASGFVVESGATPKIHVSWDCYNGSNYVEVGYAYRAAGDGAQNWYDISDTNLGTSITGTEGRVNTDYAMHCEMELDSSGYPAIMYEEGTSLDDVKFIKWNGSSWDSATILSGTAISGSIGGLKFSSDTQVEAYVAELVSGVMEIRHHRGTLNGSWSFSLQTSITSGSTDGGVVNGLGNGYPKLVKNATAADVLLVWTYSPEGTPSTVRAYPQDIVSTDFDTVNPTWVYIDRFDRVKLGTEYIANRRYGGWQIASDTGAVALSSNRLQINVTSQDNAHYARAWTQHQYSFTEGIRFRTKINKTSWGANVRLVLGIMDVSAGWYSNPIPNTAIHAVYTTTTSVSFQIIIAGTWRVNTACTVGSGDNEIGIVYDFTSGKYEFYVDGVLETSGTLDAAYRAAAQAVDTPFASIYTYVATTQIYEVTYGEYIDPEPTWGVAGSLETECSPDITNTPSSWSVNSGTPVDTSSTYTTGLTHFQITNNSGGAVDISIQGTDMTGGNTWTLSDTATPGSMTYGLKAGLSGGDYTIIVKKNSPYNDLVTSLADSGTQQWGLKLYTPTVHTDGALKSMTTTITATCV